MIRRLAIILSFLPTCTAAHDIGCDHKPVPDNIKLSCCGPADYHLLDMGQITENPDGSYKVTNDKYTFTIPAAKAEPAPDGCPAIFYSEAMKGADGIPIVFCFMIPFTL